MKTITNENGRTEIKVNEIVGIRNNELVVLEYVFKDTNNFHGAVGHTMDLITQEYVDKQNDVDYLAEELDYLWREAVANKQTEEGLRDYMQELVDNCSYDDSLFPMDDNSFRYATNYMVGILFDEQKELIKENIGEFGEGIAYWNCSGCGRCFNKDDEWQVIFRQDLIDLINEYETQEEK